MIDWGWARWFGGCWSNDGGLRQGRDPLCVIGGVVEGEEGVTSECEVGSRRAELFEKATTVFDPGRSSKTRFDNGESKLI
jgi:hypothetical protein